MENNFKIFKDGIHWSEGVAQSGPVGDRTTAFYNPFTQKWAISLRQGSKADGRSRGYLEMKIQRWQLAWRIHWLKE